VAAVVAHRWQDKQELVPQAPRDKDMLGGTAWPMIRLLICKRAVVVAARVAPEGMVLQLSAVQAVSASTAALPVSC
jgi:hypothetical protein